MFYEFTENIQISASFLCFEIRNKLVRAGNRSEDIVWTLSGNQLDQWKFGQAPVVSAQSGYQVGIWNGLYSGTSLINVHHGF